MKKKPFIVSFEGIEGSGKTTQFNDFLRRLKKSRLSVLALREPGSTALGEKVRNILLNSYCKIDPLTETLLFCAARVQMIREKILPLKGKVDIIVLDRFFDSTLAYQGSNKNLDLDYKYFEKMVIGLALGVEPDLTFVFDLSPGVSLRRKRDKDRFFMKKIQFHRGVRLFYRKLAKKFPRRIVVVDAAKSRGDVSKMVWEKFLKKCPKRFSSYIRP